ncbi:MAG: adenylyltransferase/cytidyltransferase family protein [Pyrinomonadaceae bacterium]
MQRCCAPILDRGSLTASVADLREHRAKIVLANGCFDLFHVGHLRYLLGAADLADVLIVGINSDVQTRKIKGDGRPHTSESERAEIIAGLRCVDIVTIFNEPTVEELLLAIKPDFHAKGTDYTIDTVPERDIVRSYGGIVAIVGDPKDHSSTEIIERLGKR